MLNTRGLKPGRFVVSALLAMAAVTPLGLITQRWMTYELLGVDGGFGEWCLAIAMLIVIGLATALFVGVPCYLVTKCLRLAGTRRALVFCGLASAVTVLSHRAVAPFATTTVDHAVVPVLALVFFGVFYACYYRCAVDRSSQHANPDTL